ncbi:MAG: maleylpyruvate isomerase family mycothiol-dependent enzyme [Streptosporangiaceae bacterium]
MTAVTSEERAFALSRRWMERGTAEFIAASARIDDDGLGEHTALTGWTRRHVIAHVAANAEALGRLARWARTGEEHRMYSSPEQRNDDIENGSRLPATELRQWLDSSAQQLAGDLSELSDAQWSHRVVTAQGRTVPARVLPWLRSREVMVHAVDLGSGTTFADLPAAFLTALVGDVVVKRSASANGPSVTVQATDTGGSWDINGTGERLTVRGSLADVAGWLTGRPGGGIKTTDGTPIPLLPAWL